MVRLVWLWDLLVNSHAQNITVYSRQFTREKAFSPRYYFMRYALPKTFLQKGLRSAGGPKLLKSKVGPPLSSGEGSNLLKSRRSLTPTTPRRARQWRGATV